MLAYLSNQKTGTNVEYLRRILQNDVKLENDKNVSEN